MPWIDASSAWVTSYHSPLLDEELIHKSDSCYGRCHLQMKILFIEKSFSCMMFLTFYRASIKDEDDAKSMDQHTAKGYVKASIL